MKTSVLRKRQYQHKEYRFTVAESGGELQPGTYRAVVTLRYDDECGNGHNTFAATASVYGGPAQRYAPKGEPAISGACAGMLAKYMPDKSELAEFDKWRLCSSDGPMHYPGNVLFFAGNRDCYGRAKGQESAWEYGIRFNGVPLTHRIRTRFWHYLKERMGTGEFTAVPIAREKLADKTFDFQPKWTPPGFAERWHECPWDDKTEADEWCAALNTCQVEFTRVPTAWSKGKERELDNARSAAIWPEATDEELSAEPEALKTKLETRLPGLLADFRKFIEAQGFTF